MNRKNGMLYDGQNLIYKTKDQRKMFVVWSVSGICQQEYLFVMLFNKLINERFSWLVIQELNLYHPFSCVIFYESFFEDFNCP